LTNFSNITIKQAGFFFIFTVIILFSIGSAGRADNADTGKAENESCRINPPFALTYRITPQNIDKTTFIKTGIAEYFSQSDEQALFYVVFYPYSIKPENWRDIYKYEKTSPSDFVIIKLEIRGSHPLEPGTYLTTETGLAGRENRFIPHIQVPGSIYEGTRGKGKLILTSAELKKHGRITGFVEYADSNFSINGNFEAKVYYVK
jgi:hypothetical protein